MNCEDTQSEPPSIPTIPFDPQCAAVNADIIDDSITTSKQFITSRVYKRTLGLESQRVENKGTKNAYSRHVRNYETWWELEQVNISDFFESQGKKWVQIPAHPITGWKVAYFLEHESTRSKKKYDGTDMNTNGATGEAFRLGPSSISQCISALENYRRAHERDEAYQSSKDAHLPLRSSHDVRFTERSVKESEPERQAASQVVKRTGLIADTYTEEQLTQASIWLLMSRAGSSHTMLHTNFRDRAMLLLTCNYALRGQSVRSILFSDLLVKLVPLIDRGLEDKEPALVIMANQSKTNLEGRQDQHGAFRHRVPELCAIGALAHYFFSMFHILKHDVPNFLPDYSRDGEYGYRDWYDLVLFPGGKSPTEGMSRENHHERVNRMKKANGIEIRKATHGGRAYTAQEGMDHLSTEGGMKAHGLWRQDAGVYRQCYARSLPADAMIAAAGFNGQKQASYYVPRSVLEPPDEVEKLIFPFIEVERQAYEHRREQSGKRALDNALSSFLDAFMYLRRCLVQDVAELSSTHPDMPILQFSPFNTPQFREFALASTQEIQGAQDAYTAQVNDVPESFASTIRGTLLLGTQLQEQHRNSIDKQIGQMFEIAKDMSTPSLSSNPRKKRPFFEDSSSSKQVTSRPRLDRDVEPAQIPIPAGPCTTSLPPTATPLPDSQTEARSVQPISGHGTVFPSKCFPLSQNVDTRAEQIAALTALEEKFSGDRLRLHAFEWKEKSNRKEAEWLPVFESFWAPRQSVYPARNDIWREYRYGIDGMLSISELTEHWQARWKRDVTSIKSENYRRSKIWSLVEKLVSQNGWDDKHALEFLDDKYPISIKGGKFKTTRSFIDYLKPATVDSILAESSTYINS